MNERKKAQIIISIIFIAIAVGLAFVVHDETNSRILDSTAVAPAPMTTVTITDTKSPYLTISGTYPTEGVGWGTIETIVRDTIAKFKIDNDFSKTSAKDIALLRLSDSRHYILDISYSNAHSQKFFTHRLDVYTDTGGAHGNNVVQTYTYNLKSQLIGFDDLFSDPSSALPVISAKVRALLLADQQHQDYLSDSFDTGTAPTEGNFSAFEISGNNLVIIFQEYQIAPYVEGNIEESIPLADIKDLLKPEYQ